MKGIISTNTILKSVLNKSLKLLDQPLLSHIALFKLPSYHKPLIISDAAMNINPDEQMKISIIDNALRVAEKIGVTEPKVALMKGIISTNTILKSVLNKSLKLLDQPLLSHIALFKLPSYHKPLIISDAAMNINPDEQMKISIIDNALRVAEKIGVTEPKVALISAAEKVNPKIESTVINQSIADNHHFKNAVVEGPMSYDLALSKAAAEVKSYESKVAGDVDILIMPNIDAGNVLYKALTISAGAHVAGLIIGLKAPFILTSRADSKDEKLNSLKLAFQLLT